VTEAKTPPILEKLKLGFPWVTADPFLFCVHHDDAYPAGTETLGPATSSLAGRNLGQDFEVKDGWRMYHGEVVPGFPAHPHRGFETVTIVRRGLIDHSDSLGATARFGKGDVQWLTAGRGIVHCEMFPLVNAHEPNPLELFQIWLNLPASDKLVDPHFSMIWANDIPRLSFADASGKKTSVTVVAGALTDQRAPSPPPKSWASRADTDVAIWTIEMDAGATWTLPPTAHPDAIRTLYLFRGESLAIEGERVDVKTGAVIANDRPLELVAGPAPVDILMLQGRPIAEPVVQHGPFVMTTRTEIQKAMLDYQRTRFGDWPWKNDAPVHARGEGRFAKHADGRIEKIER
jgi:redox-sensitive bicupin YhaK (pirin superfamily)